mgnify:CR=1 FL=1
MANVIPVEAIESKILLIRGKKVMLDKDLALLYGVTTKHLKRSVMRNPLRFPSDFMFKLNKKEYQNLRCQFGTSSWGGTRYFPYVFTEQGVAMLSSVLNSRRAILVNLQIMRTFIKLRELLSSHRDLKQKIEELEQKYDHQFKVVFDVIKELIDPKVDTKPKQFGFVPSK